ncbi:MAG: hypothetical protein LHW45_08090 [Candidatus Cloacimonetes bacterium]|nr:hypothetical protein [Candidatus Cloacimonadota bacterium]MDY0367569.1 hypothetical protein [Candidatus Syntrophosphaera sp.]
MQKPAVITAFTGDTIDLRISLYDSTGSPLALTTLGLTVPTLSVDGLDEPIAGSVSGNVVSLTVPKETALEAGTHPFYAQIADADANTLYTIAYGHLIIKDLPVVTFPTP